MTARNNSTQYKFSNYSQYSVPSKNTLQNELAWHSKSHTSCPIRKVSRDDPILSPKKTLMQIVMGRPFLPQCNCTIHQSVASLTAGSECASVHKGNIEKKRWTCNDISLFHLLWKAVYYRRHKETSSTSLA